MADVVFPKGLEGFLDNSIIWKDSTSTVKCMGLRGYVYDPTDKFLSDVTGSGATIAATSAALTSKTATNGVADAADALFQTVPIGAAITSVIVVQTSAVTGGIDLPAGQQRLIAFFDDAGGDLPATPNGLDINLPITNLFGI